MAIKLYQETDYEGVISGGTDGVEVTASSPLDAGLFDTEADAEGDGIKCALRTDGGTETGVTVAPTRDEDFAASYTETDPNGRITVTSSRITASGLTRNEDAYVYRDMGAGYFGGDFEVRLAVHPEQSSDLDALVNVWAVANDVGDSNDLTDYLTLQAHNGAGSSTAFAFYIKERYAGSTYSGALTGVPFGSTYYIKIIRDESAGTYGTLYLYVYSDEEMSNLYGSASVALHAKADFRYAYGMMTHNGGTTQGFDGWVENLWFGGTADAYYALSLDGTNWEAWGDPLSVGSVGTTNVVFYAKARGLTTDSFGKDDAYLLIHDSSDMFAGADSKRRVVPYLQNLGSGSSNYLGFDFGPNTFEHDTANGGEFDVVETTGASGNTYNDIKFSTCDHTGGVFTMTKSLTNCDVTAVVTKKKAGVYLYEVTIENTDSSERRFLLTKNITGTAPDGTSTVSLYKDSGTKDLSWPTDQGEVFQAAALHHSGGDGVAVGLVADDGWDNDWTIFNIAAFSGDTDQYNGRVLYKTASLVELNYGRLANSSTTDYTIHIPAGGSKTLRFVVALDAAEDQREVNRMMYSGLHDAVYSGPDTHTEVEKLLWATSWQLQRIRRHDHSDPTQYPWQVSSMHYAPNMHTGADAPWQVMGLNDENITDRVITSFASSGDDAVPMQPDNPMDSSEPNLNAAFYLYAMNFLGYTPSQAVIDAYAARADTIASGLGLMLPRIDDVYAGPAAGMSDFEADFSYTLSAITYWIWADASSGTGAAARVAAEGGVTPQSGSYMVKLQGDKAGDVSSRKSMKIYTAPSRAHTFEQYVNIPSSGNVTLRVYEYDASNNLLATNESSSKTSTSGWERQAVSFTTDAGTAYVVVAPYHTGAGTAYIDDVQGAMDSPPWPGMMWSNARIPDALDSGVITVNQPRAVYVLLDMKCIKGIIGANWTQAHQDALDAMEATWPAAYWWDASHDKLRYALYHPVRKNWLWSGCIRNHFEWYIISGGEKVFTDQEISDLYSAYPKTGLGYGYGDVAFLDHVVKPDGSYTESSEWVDADGPEGTPYGTGGYYQNGGSWLLMDARWHLVAQWAGVSGAAESLQKRLRIEVGNQYASHEYLDTDSGLTYYRTCYPDQRGYGWNAILLADAIPFSLQASNVDAEGCDLTWDEYTGGSFDYYSVCRSTSPNVTTADEIDTVTPSTTHTYHDTSADPDTAYFYKVFVVKTAGTDLQSEEIEVTTASLSVTLQPSAQSLALSPGAALVGAGATLAPSVQAATAHAFSPSVLIPHAELPSAQSAAVSVPAPAVTAGWAIHPAALYATASVPSSAVRAGATLHAGVQALSVSTPAPSVEALSAISPLGLTASLARPDVFTPLAVEKLRGRTRLEPVWLVEVELLNSGPTLYFSDRNVTVGGRRYENYLEGLSGSEERFDLRFRNDPFMSYGRLVEIGDEHPFEGAAVTVKEVYLDPSTGSGQAGGQSEPVELFRGVLEEPRRIDLMGFACGVTPVDRAMDRKWSQPVINTSDYPFAHEDLGEVEPIVYGSQVLVPALRVDWGARTTLQVKATAEAAGLVLSDASRFPSSGSVWVDNEKVSYAAKSGNALTGCSRAQDGTEATAHRAGADVVEARGQYDSLLASHELQGVGEVYAEVAGRLWRAASGVSAVLQGGKHLLRANDHVRLEAVEDATGVDNYYTPPVRKISRRALGLPFQWEGFASGVFAAYLNFPSAPAGLTLTNVRLRLHTYVSSFTAPDADVYFYLGDTGGTKICRVDSANNLHYYLDLPLEVSKSGWVTSQKITKSGGFAPDTFITIYDAEIEADVVSDFGGDPEGGTVERSGTNLPLQSSQSLTVNFPAAPPGTLKDVHAEYEWSVIVNGNPSSTVKFRAGSEEICWVTASGIVVPFCDYRFLKSHSGWATSEQLSVVNSHPDVVFTVKRAAERAISSAEGSVSSAVKSGGLYGAHVVERFHALVEGYKDPDGSYGGAGGVIERPDRVMRHFLVEVLGIPPEEIDSASFDAAGASYASAISGGYALAFRIDRKIRPSELLLRMARECRSALRYRAGKWRLDYLPDSAPGAVKTISGGELAGPSAGSESAKFTFLRTPLDELSNGLTARYRRNYSRLGRDSEWDGTATASDSASQAKYGAYPGAVDFELIRDQAMASHVLSHMLLEGGEPRLTVEFQVFWEYFDLAPGDTIEIDSPLYGGRKFLVEDVTRLGKARARVRAREWWG
jgi:hypothetical protein